MNLPDTVELSVVDGSLVIRPSSTPRQGWDAAFGEFAAVAHDALLAEGVGHLV